MNLRRMICTLGMGVVWWGGAWSGLESRTKATARTGAFDASRGLVIHDGEDGEVQGAGDTDSTQNFVWLDAQKNADAWQAIEDSFARELKPDVAQEVMPYEPMMYKKVIRVAAVGDATLVLIEKRVSERARFEYVSAFSYDLKTQEKTALPMKWMMWNWKYYGTAHFEPGVPDILFTFQSCTNCDATSILGAFDYQASAKVWKVRLWEGDEQGILIGSKQESSRGQIVDDCVFAVKDFEGKGNDQVLDFCRRREQGSDPPFKVFTTTYRADIFQVVDGRSVGRSTKNTTERKKLLIEICKTEGANELCSQAQK